jgi:CTP-dependent riboflavin kinase
LNVTKLDGVLFTGEGNGRRYLSLPWVKQQLETALGYTPYLGTLNLKLTAESAKLKREIAQAKATVICPAEGYCVGLLFKAVVEGINCAVIVPQVKNYPEDVLEVVAQVSLRDALGLKDGDCVVVSVQS